MVSALGDSGLRAVVLIIALLLARIYLIFYDKGEVYPSISTPVPHVTRGQVLDRLELLLSQRRHLYITGSSGVGKTSALLHALPRLISRETNVLPVGCYVDLTPLLSIPQLPDEQLLRLVKDNIIEQVSKFDHALLQQTRATGGPISWLTAFLARYWLYILAPFPFRGSRSYSTFPHSEVSKWGHSQWTLSTILSHVSKSSSSFNGLYRNLRVWPILVIDGLQVLSDPRFSVVNEELVSFLGDVFPLKERSGTQVVLISSESIRGNSLLAKLAMGPLAGTSLEPLVHHEVIGDLTMSETRELLLSFGANAVSTDPDASPNLKIPPQDVAQEIESDSAGDVRESMEQIVINSGEMETVVPTTTVKSLVPINRLFQRVANDSEFEAIYSRYGGYLPDLSRFALTQRVAIEEDVVLPDRSRVSQLLQQQQLDQRLEDLKLDANSLLVLYRAMLETGKSPRAAVLLSEVVETLDVPQDLVIRLESLGLIELRDSGNPSVLDYGSLRGMRGEAYICAPSPLSRFSMARIVKKLEKLRYSRGGAGSAGGSFNAGGGSKSMKRHKAATAHNEL